MEGERIDRRKLMDDEKLARLAKARERKEELRVKREADKLDLLKKKVLADLGQQEVDAEEKARLKQEKWDRRKAEMLAEFQKLAVAPLKTVKSTGKASRSGSAIVPRKKPLKNAKNVEPDTEESEDSEYLREIKWLTQTRSFPSTTKFNRPIRSFQGTLFRALSWARDA